MKKSILILATITICGCDDIEYHKPTNQYSELLIKTKQGPSEYKFRGGRGVQLVSICRVDASEKVIDCIENVSDVELIQSRINISPVIRNDKTGTCGANVPQVRLGSKGYVQFNMTSDIISGDKIRIAVIESPECILGYEYELYGVEKETGQKSLICEGAFTKSCIVK